MGWCEEYNEDFEFLDRSS